MSGIERTFSSGSSGFQATLIDPASGNQYFAPYVVLKGSKPGVKAMTKADRTKARAKAKSLLKA